jgi:predicted ester cyclase
MTAEETERTIRGYLDNLLTGGDFAAFFDDEIVWTTMETGDQIRGREAVRDFIVALHTQWFDAAPEVRTVTFANGVAGLEAVFAATHTGEFAGIPPTGLQVRLPYACVYDVANEKITALRAYFPILALIQQLQSAPVASAL